MTTRRKFLLGLAGTGTAAFAGSTFLSEHRLQAAAQVLLGPPQKPVPISAKPFAPVEQWAAELIAAAEKQVRTTVNYNGAYVKLAYPMGDISPETGVCTDVIIRAYRTAFRIDLQTLVHEDMKQHFGAYPKIWGLKRPDRSIDHRRVPNLEHFFTRRRADLPVTRNPRDYLPGDLVSQRLPGNLPHIAIVSHRPTSDGERPLLIHNIGAGARIEDRLLDFEITGHFRFSPENA